MKNGINRTLIAGNLTNDPQDIANGKGVSFGIAHAETYQNKQGNEVEEVSYFTVKVWGKQGDPCKQYLSKGSAVIVEGRLKQERWEKDGSKQSAVVITATQVQFIDGKKE